MTFVSNLELAGKTFVDHYTAPWLNEDGEADVGIFVSNMHGISQIQSYDNPAAAVYEAADAVMKEEFINGDRFSPAYDLAYDVRFLSGLITAGCGFVAGVADAALYFGTSQFIPDTSEWLLLEDRAVFKMVDHNYFGEAGAKGLGGYLIKNGSGWYAATLLACSLWDSTFGDGFVYMSISDVLRERFFDYYGINPQDPDWMSQVGEAQIFAGAVLGGFAVAHSATAPRLVKKINEKQVPEEGCLPWFF